MARRVTQAALWCTTIAVIVGRLLIVPRLDLPTAEGSYEAFAHLFVGGLFGAWMVKRTEWLWLSLAIAASILELVIFIVQKSF
jgi:hypothetical protein